MTKMELKIYNTLTEKKEIFIPIDENNIRMYVCGPTVYSRPHIGNARSYIIYDILFRVLKHVYPKIIYVRNITDVDDKIIDCAKKTNSNVTEITKNEIKNFHEDTDALYCLRPTYEPKATEHIMEMLEMIDDLVNKHFAYIKDNHVLFSVEKFENYGCLSKKKLADLISGVRINVELYKKNDHDFVLWKPADKNIGEYGFESKFGYGRPGWHIECSAMSKKYLGDEFDIHGGGSDLKFPHHDNEIAQSICSSGKNFAKYWIHNGFLTINGEKMSKSLGNFITPRDLINQNYHPEAIRLALISTIYSKPLDFSEKLIKDSEVILEKFYKTLSEVDDLDGGNIFEKSLEAILDDLNTPRYMATMHYLMSDIVHCKNGNHKIDMIKSLYATGKLIGIFNEKPLEFLTKINKNNNVEIPQNVIELANLRLQAKNDKNYEEADKIRLEVEKYGYKIEDLSNQGFKITKIDS